MSIPELPDLLACYRHANRYTGVQCTRCGRPICPDCMIEAPVGHQCPTCVHDGPGPGDQPVRWNPADRTRGLTPVVRALIGINVVVFILTSSVHPAWQLRFAQIPLAVAHGQSYRLLTAAFLHANFFHILFNMFALAILGPPVEEVMGRRRFLTLYLLSALGGSVLSFLLGPVNVAGVGASGAIFGIFGAWFCIARSRRAETSGIVVLIAINLAFSFFDPAIDWRAHLGGLGAGLLLGGAFALGERCSASQRKLIEVVSGVAFLVAMVALVSFRTHRIAGL
jgi:membrane associated rhomboid family serine protease